MVPDDSGVSRYRLLQLHKINGLLHAVGAEVDLPTRIGNWLAQQGIAAPVSGQVAVAAAVAIPAPAKPRVRKCCGWK